MNKKILLSTITLVTLASLFTSQMTYAAPGSSSAASKVDYNISPILGYESVYRPTPTPHTASRFFYGARLTAGIDIISAEVEYTKATDTENFSTAPQKIAHDDQKLKLGVRSTMSFNSVLFGTLRLGGQATRSKVTETTAGVDVVTDKPDKYDPYAGATIGVRIGTAFSVSAGVTAVFVDSSNLSNTDFQTSLSFGIGRF